jgi:hypothetical protein
MNKLTQQEIDALPWNPGEKFALVDKETKSLSYTFSTEEQLKEVLDLMGVYHPLYKKLQVCKRS